MSRQLAAVLPVAAGLLLIAPLAHGTTLYVATNGVDGPSCGTKASPCRSITQGIANASTGETIIVGPGVYGDLNGDGVVPDFPGEETPSSGCDCMLSVNKGVTLLSSDGAAPTTIDARLVPVDSNVIIIADGVTFGKPGKGFTLTETSKGPLFLSQGVAIDGSNVTVQGNQALNVPFSPINQITFVAPGIIGIATVVNDSETVLIEANQVVGWKEGIVATSSDKQVLKNQVSSNTLGIVAGNASIVAGNIVTNNSQGIHISGSVRAENNAVYANYFAGFGVDLGFSGTIAKNNIVGNGAEESSCGLGFSGTGLLAAENYWGAATGPGAGANVAGCVPGSSVTVTPFATKPFSVKAPIKP